MLQTIFHKNYIFIYINFDYIRSFFAKHYKVIYIDLIID